MDDRLVCLCLSLGNEVIDLYSAMQAEGEKFLSDKILRGGTEVGVRVFQAKGGQGVIVFLDRLDFALLNVNDTLYWLEIIYSRKLVGEDLYCRIKELCNEIRCILLSLIFPVKALR